MGERLILSDGKARESGLTSTVQLSTGGWVTAWLTWDSEWHGSVKAQVFGADGSMIGDKMVIDRTVASGSYALDVHAQADGGWSIRWSENVESSFDQHETHFQSFSSDGTLDGAWEYRGDDRDWPADEFADGTLLICDPRHDRGFVKTDFKGTILATYEFPNLESSWHAGRFDILQDGGWVAAWSDGNTPQLKMQRYGANGELLGSLQVLDGGSTNGYNGNVTALNDGGWIIYWEDTGDGKRYVSRFDADGDTVIDRRRVEYVRKTSVQFSETVALEDGGWMTIWTNPKNGNHAEAMILQRFNADGSQNGENSLFGTHDGHRPDITMLDDGGWLVTWSNARAEWSGVYQLRFNAEGDEIFSNTAPQGADTSIHVDEDGIHVFSRSDLPMKDFNGDNLEGVTIDDITGGGRLMLGKHRLEAGTYVSAAAIDAGKMTFVPGPDDSGREYATFSYSLRDDGGTANGGKDTDPKSNVVTIGVSTERDKILGTSSNESLTGTKSGDLIIGEGGNDVLRGKGGDDIFQFKKGHGRDIIMDFDVHGDDHDFLDLRKGWSHRDYKHGMSQEGDDLILRDMRPKFQDDIIILKDVRLDDLDHTMVNV